MSEDLKELLHETADVDFAAPDLATITRAGDRAVRRRRVLAGVAGVAATAVIAAGAVALTGDAGREAPVAVNGAVDVTDPTWVEGSVLHSPSGKVDLGFDVTSYVRTTEGFVFTDGEGVVRRYDGRGAVTEIGRTGPDWPGLTADTDGTRVGWVDRTGERPAFVVHDLATGGERRFGAHTASGTRSGPNESDPVILYAIDGTAAYWRDSRGAVATDLETGQSRVLDPDASGWADGAIGGAEDGLLARRVEGAGGDGPGTEIATADGQRVALLAGVFGPPMVFSPDARWVISMGDRPAVYDVRTGDPIRTDLDGSPFSVGHEWLDTDTLVGWSAPSGEGSVELLSCEVPAGDCSVLMDDLGALDDMEGEFLLPGGEPPG